MDRELLLALNSLLTSDEITFFIASIGNNPVLRGFPVFFCIIALWFSVDSDQRRSRMLIGLFAACCATIASVSLQRHFTPHIRPLIDPTLHINIVSPYLTQWDRPGSFPSDTATLFFALVTIVFIENRLIGALCLVWSILTVGFARIALGYHYPSDILGSLVLGPTVVLLLQSIPQLRAIVQKSLSLFNARQYVVHGLLFILLAEAENLFLGFQGILKYSRYLIGTASAAPPIVY